MVPSDRSPTTMQNFRAWPGDPYIGCCKDAKVGIDIEYTKPIHWLYVQVTSLLYIQGQCWTVRLCVIDGQTHITSDSFDIDKEIRKDSNLAIVLQKVHHGHSTLVENS